MQTLLLSIFAAILIITIKEFTKALISASLGDPLPRRDMRITLNPLKHIEVVGLFLIIFTGLGWGKTVSTSSLYYKNRKRDTLITYILPSLVILLFGLIVHYIIVRVYLPITIFSFLRLVSVYGVSLAIFNIIPIQPMDGSKVLSVFLKPNQVVSLSSMEKTLLIILVLIILLWPNDPITRTVFTITQYLLMATILLP